MANINWIGGSGSWNTAADWSNGTTPTDVDTVNIDVPLITVSVTGTSAAYTLNTNASTLAIVGGTLTTIAGADFGGAFTESSGVYIAGGTGAVFADGITMTGGTIEAQAGAALSITGGGTLAGAFSGAGQLDINGGNTYIQTGFTSSLSSIVVSANLGFDTAFTTHADFTVNGSGNVDLFGNKLTLAGISVIDGTIGNGSLTDSGTLTLGSLSALETLDNGLSLGVTGTLIQSGNINQGTGDAGAKIAIGKTGQYLINGNWTISDPNPSIGTLTNAGILAKTGGGKTATIATSLTNSGTLQADSGTLLLTGLVNSIGGSVSGSGTLALGGAQTTFGPGINLTVAGLDLQTGVLVLNKSLVYGGNWDMNGNAVLNLNSAKEKLTLSGRSNFDGGTISGYGGTVLITGMAQMGSPGQTFVIGGPNTLTVSGAATLDQTGAISLGNSSNPVIDIQQGGIWYIEGDSSISGSFGLIDNAGTFIDPNGSGTATVQSQFESTGTLTVNAATLQFQGQTALSGTVTGSGTLDLNGTTTLQSGLALSVAALTIDNSVAYLGETLSYGNIFSQIGNSMLDLGGHQMSLSGAASLDGGTLTDTGTLAASGATTVGSYNIDNAATLLVTGKAEQTGPLNLAGGTLAIASTGTYSFDDDVSITGTGLLSLAGTLNVGSAGNSTIYAALNQTGTLIANDQTLTLAGGGTLAGAISGTGSLVLGTGSFALASSLADTVATLDVRATATLGGATSYAGNYDQEGTLNLNAATLSLTGATILNGAILSGQGAMNALGSTTFSNLTLQNGATLNITGVAEQGPQNTYDNGGTLAVAAGGTLSLDGNQSIFGGGVLDVAGQLIAGGNGVGVLNVAINDTGVITTNIGTLDIGGAVIGKGSFSIGANASLIFSNSSSITAATTVAFAGTNATLDIQNSIGANMSTFAAGLADFSTKDMIEINGINAQSAVGTLSANGLQYTVSDSNGDTLMLTFTTKEAPGSISVGSISGTTTLFHT